ncbi:MAG: hypothetical protein BWX50_00753 [Euryarchaeota archaeon ADurb.Bin009]|nr:MAG: hypothetical protein BWX50_00753 [Euryarchaeota archaeon ADurb.Bin009]
MALQRHRPVRVANKVCPEFLRKQPRHADRGREVEELGIGGDLLEAGDQPVEAVAPVGVLEHLDLVDDDGPDAFHGPPGAEGVIDPLVGPHHDGGADVPLPGRTGLGEVEAAHPGLQGDPHQVAVTVAEPLILLVCECDQRDQEEHPPPPFEEVLHAGHLPDERLAARGGGDDEEVLPLKKPALDGELLDGHQVLDAGGLCKRGGQGKVGDMGGLLDLVRLEPVKEGPRPVGLLRPHRREHPVEVADLGKEFLEMDEHGPAELTHVAEFPAHLAFCTLHADPLSAVPDTGRLIDGDEPVLKLAVAADIDPGRMYLEVGKERLKLRAPPRKVDRRPAQERYEVTGRGGLELFSPPAHLEVLGALAFRRRGQVDVPGTFDTPAFDE